MTSRRKSALPRASPPKTHRYPRRARALNPEVAVSERQSPRLQKGVKRKTKIEEEEDGNQNSKQQKTLPGHDLSTARDRTPATRRRRLLTVQPPTRLNRPPTDRLHIFVFGAGEYGELGLGTTKSKEVRRPRLNANLSAASVGVVQVAVGGLHCAALTYDNRILTWGVNDHGTLGRETQHVSVLVAIDDNHSGSDSDNGETGLNPREAVPAPVDASHFLPGTVFAQLVAGDSSTFALTEDGLVYGWGTFRGDQGILGFTPETEVQKQPALVDIPQRVTKLAAGDNHVLALGVQGQVFAWGAEKAFRERQRISPRIGKSGLLPQQMLLPTHIIDIAAGANHCFAIHRSGKVYGWGANERAQTGIPRARNAVSAAIVKPTRVRSLECYDRVKQLDGGNVNSVAVTESGACLTWGCIDNFATGLAIDSIPTEHAMLDERGRKKILIRPTRIPGIDVLSAAAGGEHCIAVTKDGKAYSWGFSSGGRTGQGTEEDIECATLIDNTAIRDQKIIWAGAGGTFSVLASKAAC